MFVPNFIKLSVAIYELLFPQAFLPYLAMVKNPIAELSCTKNAHREKKLAQKQ